MIDTHRVSLRFGIRSLSTDLRTRVHTFRQAERTRDRQDLARDVCPLWVKNEKKSDLVVGRSRFRPSSLGHFQNRLYWRALRGVSLQGTPTREARIVVKKKKKKKKCRNFATNSRKC